MASFHLHPDGATSKQASRDGPTLVVEALVSSAPRHGQQHYRVHLQQTAHAMRDHRRRDLRWHRGRIRDVPTRSRRLSEKDAYTLLRQTVMSQNKRIFEIAEAIVSMIDILKGLNL